MRHMFKSVLIGALLLLFSQAAVSVSWGVSPMLSTGDTHSVALDDSGTLWAWGSNITGQLGDDSGFDSLTPVQVGNPFEWVQVVAGQFHSLAIKTDGTLWAWGSNVDGRLGIIGPTQPTPTQVGLESNWLKVAAGDDHSLAIKDDGTLWAWGSNLDGQLGDGTDIDQPLPVQVGTDSDWQQVTAGSFHSLAIKNNGTLWAWGNNSQGQLGDPSWLSILDVKLAPFQVGVDGDWMQVTAGSAHSVAIKSDGTLWAWGGNTFGQLGDGSFSVQLVPHQVGTDPWLQVSAGGSHTLAIKTDNTLWAWGLNDEFQLGDATSGAKNVPVPIGVDSDWSQTTADIFHSLAFKTDGTVWGWGQNGFGVSGTGTDLFNIIPTVAGIGINTDISTNNLPRGVVTVTGSAIQGATVTADIALADLDVLGAFDYRWQRGVSGPFVGTGNTYVLTQADVGTKVRVAVSYTDGASTLESVTSLSTSAVANVNELPTGTVTISGTATEGQILTAGNSLNDLDGLGTFSYSWNRAGAPIAGANADTYTLVQDDIASSISVTATYIDGWGTIEAATSAATTAIIWADATKDTDGDSIPDNFEILNGLNPAVGNAAGADADGDGFSDYHEFLLGLDPLVADIVNAGTDVDGDGIIDQIEINLGLDPGRADATEDPDSDGLTNAEEIAVGTLPLVANITLPDTDGDRLPDTTEILAGLDLTANNSATDLDGDVMTDLVEYFNGTLALSNAVLIDTDIDGLPDIWERSNGLNPAISNLMTDTDMDGLLDPAEYLLGLDPSRPDTDADGLNDLDETTLGTDPTLADTDGDGVVDGDDSFPLDASQISNGDLDKNNLVEAVDALLALQIAVGRQAVTAENLKYADVAPFISGRPAPDGQMTAGDALVILRKAVGLVSW